MDEYLTKGVVISLKSEPTPGQRLRVEWVDFRFSMGHAPDMPCYQWPPELYIDMKCEGDKLPRTAMFHLTDDVMEKLEAAVRAARDKRRAYGR